MINELQKDLNQLVINNKSEQHQIVNLFLNLEEVSAIFSKNIVFQNPFETLRVEISEMIFDFLDMKTVLAFRLSSKFGNQLILLLLQNKVNKLQNKKEKLQQEFAQYESDNSTALNSQEANQLFEQFHKNQMAIQALRPQDIGELRAFSNPPQVVVKTLELLTILLNYTKQVSSWGNSKQLLSNPQSLMRDLIEYDVTTITDKQLEKLQEIYQIPLQPNLIPLVGLRVFYQYIISIVKLRESNLISIFAKQNRFKKLISFINNSIYGLQKILH